jgi:hypothetical protein
MTDPTCSVPSCDRPAPDNAYICPKHTESFERDLGDAPALMGELATTQARQDRTGERGLGRTVRASEPIPFNDSAGHDLRSMQNTFTTWARHVSEERGIELPCPPRPPAGPRCAARCVHTSCALMREADRLADRWPAPGAVAARFLLGHGNVEWIRHRPEAMEIYDELRHAVWSARRAVDSAEPRWYAGQCGAETLTALLLAMAFGGEADRCPTELYARPGASSITCPTCDTVHVAKERQRWLVASAADAQAHAELISRGARALGKKITAAMVRGYAFRGRILERGTDSAGRPLYRFGDVTDTYDLLRRKRAEATLRRAVREAEEIAAAAAEEASASAPGGSA